MLTDARALAAALVASRLAARPARGPWTFGFGRAEILAAQANGITLAARRRLDRLRRGPAARRPARGARRHRARRRARRHRRQPRRDALLAPADRESLNVRGAFLHVATDLAAFVGTAVAGALVLATGWDRFDPIAGLLVAALMLRSSWSLLRESGRIFLEVAPAGIDPERSRARSPRTGRRRGARPPRLDGDERLPRALGARARRARRRLPRVRRGCRRCCDERFGLDHTTLQVDHAPGARSLARRSTAR